MFECFKLKILSNRLEKPILNENEIKKIIQNNNFTFFVENKIIQIPSNYIHPGGLQCLINNNFTECSTDYNFHSKEAKKLWDEFCVGLAYKKDLEKYIKLY